MMIDQLKPLLGKFTNFAQNKMGFDYPPKLFLKQDVENAKGLLGRTAHYDPQNKSITIFITGRHPKDILRSFAHELVHHTQNLRGDLSPEKCGQMTDKYAQENPHMRKMEEEAYLIGNMCFRDWEDSEKFTMKESKMLKENKKMTTKITKGSLKNMIRTILKEKMETVNEEGDMFAPNHYCIHHGGVQHEGKIVAAEAVQHNYDEVLGKVTHYNMKLPDGTILENVAAEDIQVTNATLESSHSGKRDDGHKPVKKVKKMEEAEEEVEEGHSMKDPRSAMAPPEGDDREFDYEESDPMDDLPMPLTGLSQEDLIKLIAAASAKLASPEDDMSVGPLEEEEEEIEEGGSAARVGNEDKDQGRDRMSADRIHEDEEEDIEEGAKPDYIDIDGDGDKEESMKKAAADKEKNESKIQTPEQENALYENRFSNRNAKLFEDLVKKWTK